MFNETLPYLYRYDKLKGTAFASKWIGIIELSKNKSEGAIKYSQGAVIQNACPYLSASDRELLITGICDPCWDETMKDSDDN